MTANAGAKESWGFDDDNVEFITERCIWCGGAFYPGSKPRWAINEAPQIVGCLHGAHAEDWRREQNVPACHIPSLRISPQEAHRTAWIRKRQTPGKNRLNQMRERLFCNGLEREAVIRKWRREANSPARNREIEQAIQAAVAIEQQYRREHPDDESMYRLQPFTRPPPSNRKDGTSR